MSGRRTTEGAYPKRSPKVLWREVELDVILFHEEDGRAYALNASAGRVWKMCHGASSVQEIAARAGSPVDGGKSATVAKLIGELSSHGFIEMLDSPAAEAADDSPSPSSAWAAPEMVEIVFAACDCTGGGGRGVVRNAGCVGGTKHTAQSTI
jgi:hypothetical protein